jgi:hypothetical protein
MRRSTAVALVSLLLVATSAATPAYACGCGAFAPTPDAQVAVATESAVISHVDGVENIVLSVGVDSEAVQTGLIIPTPSPATVSAGSSTLLDEAREAISPSVVYVDDWWGTDSGIGESTAPEVLDKVTVGALEATTLAASDSNGLGSWLQQNGFQIPVESSSLITQYVAKGWYFVAVKLSNEQSLDGLLDPIQVSFATDTIVYPMGMSRAAAGGQSLRLYVVSDSRVRPVPAEALDGRLNAAQRTVWAGQVSGGELGALGGYLTAIDLRYDTPALQIGGDIALVPAPNNDVVDPTSVVIRPIELLGFPLGTLLAVWGGVGALILLGAVVARSRLR